MKKQLKSVASILAALLLFSGVAFAQNPKFQVVSPSDAYLGMTYGDWAAAWWQWVIQIPNASNLFRRR
jgi:hypothetical protein